MPTKIFSGKHGEQVGYIDGTKIFRGKHGEQAGYIEGGGTIAAGAALLLLL